jgi:hypothetical protein
MPILLIILLILLFAGGGGYYGGNYFHSGYGPGFGLGTVLLVLVVCWILGLFNPRT